MKQYLCVASPYVCREDSSESRILTFPETLYPLPLTGFAKPWALINHLDGQLRNQGTLKAFQQERRGPRGLDQPTLRREIMKSNDVHRAPYCERSKQSLISRAVWLGVSHNHCAVQGPVPRDV
jgi:hypothetical protein